MLALVRVLLQAVLFLLLLLVVVTLLSTNAGILEKAVLVALAGVLTWLAVLVRHMGGPPSAPRST